MLYRIQQRAKKGGIESGEVGVVLLHVEARVLEYVAWLAGADVPLSPPGMLYHIQYIYVGQFVTQIQVQADHILPANFKQMNAKWWSIVRQQVTLMSGSSCLYAEGRIDESGRWEIGVKGQACGGGAGSM